MHTKCDSTDLFIKVRVNDRLTESVCEVYIPNHKKINKVLHNSTEIVIHGQ